MIRRFLTLSLVASLFLMLFAPTAQAQPVRNQLLSEIPVTGALSDGGTFEGLLTITGVAVEDGDLLVSGVLEGTATEVDGTVTEVNQTFTDLPASLLAEGPGSSCDILLLDLGPINLDLLGLTVDLSEVELDVRGERGPGNLLGNLLCSVAGLLDSGATSGLSNLIARINDLLGGLLG